jgi:hypothetical protein
VTSYRAALRCRCLQGVADAGPSEPLLVDGSEMRQRQNKFKSDLEKTRERLAQLPSGWEAKAKKHRNEYDGQFGGQGDDSDPPGLVFYCGLIILIVVMVFLFILFVKPSWLEEASTVTLDEYDHDEY